MTPVLSPSELRADRAQPVAVVRAGTLPYLEAWALQKDLVQRRRRGEITDVLLVVEHPPVYTLGRRTDRGHVLIDERERAARDIDLVEVDRGGDVTYHGPGQLVVYPILKLASLRGVVAHVRALEEILIRALASLSVVAHRSEGFTGVWVGDRKIAAIGVRVATGGITSHGFALNVDPRMADFDGIVPCGIADRGVCSLRDLGVGATLDQVAERVIAAAAEVFDATLEERPLAGFDRDRRPIT